MKKTLVIGLLGISIILAGCGNNNATNDSETVTDAASITDKQVCIDNDHVWNDTKGKCQPAGYMEPENTQTTTDSNGTVDTSSTTSDEGTAGSYTLADVSTHNSQESCRAAIDGSVYDLTQWIQRHPGGPKAIMSICGTDATAKFNGQHKSSNSAQSQLTNFRIGALAQ